MVIAARSTEFIDARAGDGVAGVLHSAATRTHHPWFVVTYLTHQDGIAAWETVCTESFTALLQHVRSVPGAQLAHMLVMAPPRCSPSRKWSRFRVDRVERGKHNGLDVLVYIVAGRGDFCFDSPDVYPDEVTRRRTVLHVKWYPHFSM